MARPKKPLALKSETSNLTKEQKEEKKRTEQLVKTGSEQLNKPPSWLRNAVAKKEWNRLLKEFDKMEILSNLDYNNLGMYCNSFSSLVEITEEMKGKKFADGIAANPLVNVQLKYSEELRRYASTLGLTIDSRLKMASLKISTEKNKIEDEFGEI